MANNLLTMQMITREAVQLFRNSNTFLSTLEDMPSGVIGSTLRIRLPNDYTAWRSVSLPVAVAMGAAAVVIKNPTVSRRFWSWLSA